MPLNLDQNTIDVVMASFKAAGMVLVPDYAAAETLDWQKKRQALMRKKWVTPQQIEKYRLLQPKKTAATIKNWCLNPNNTSLVESIDWYRDNEARNGQGKILILHESIKALNNK
ncbi:hypothetical protein [Algibacter sp. PT7-4]|uniref:hypothetical protein n=1 Tax=Algibacter ulvanivorans TaxID=3400999 RepID=UPI003AAEF59C